MSHAPIAPNEEAQQPSRHTLGLTSKVAIVNLALLLTISIFAAIIVWNALATNQTMRQLDIYRTEELRLTGDYHTSLQRWMTKMLAYAASGEEEEYAKALETLEHLDSLLVTWKALEESNILIEEHHHDEVLATQSALVNKAHQLSDEIGNSPAVDVREVQGAIQALEQELATLADESATQINERQIQMEYRGAQAAQTVLVTISGAFVGTLLFVGAIFWFAQRLIVRPIKHLAQATESVTRGHFSQTVAVTSQDEIGSLQLRFNEMVATLQQQRDELEARHQQTMAALDEAETARTKAEISRDEARAARTHIAEQLAIITAQQRTIYELGAPLLPLSDRIVIMPLIGAIDSQRATQILETLLAGVAQHRAELVILDITGVQVVDTQVAQSFIQAAQAVKLLGAQVMLTGIQPQIAQTLVHLGVNLSEIITRGSLQSGIEAALYPYSKPGTS